MRGEQVRSVADASLALGAGLAALACYLVCLCPTVGPGDAGELTIAALNLGIAHPPGYPLFTWLGRLATLVHGVVIPSATRNLSLCEPALATNLLTSLIAAAAVSVLFFAVRSIGLSRIGGLVAAMSFGFSQTFWQNATSHEVYSLAMLFLALLLLLVSQAALQPRLFFLTAFLLGLASSHQPTALLWLPGLALLAKSRLRPNSSRLLLVASAWFLLGLSASLGILIRAGAGPDVNWGDPSTLGRFLRHASAAQYRELSADFTLILERIPALPRILAQEFGAPAVIAALAGLAYLALRAPRKLLALLLLFLTSAFGMSYNVPDFNPHLLAAFLVVAVLAGAAVSWVERLTVTARWPSAIGHCLLLCLPVSTFVLNLKPGLESRTTIVRDLGENLVASVPPQSTLLYGSDVTGNSVRYLQTTKRIHRAIPRNGATRNLQTDLRLVSTEMLFSRVYWDELKKRFPLPDHNSALRKAGHGPRPARMQSLMLALAEAHPSDKPLFLAVELATPDFFAGPLAKAFRLVPQGIVNRLVPLADTVSRSALVGTNQRLWSSYRLRSLHYDYVRPDYQNIQIAYAGSLNNLGMFCFEQGWNDDARAFLDSALTLPAPSGFKQVIRQNQARIKQR